MIAYLRGEILEHEDGRMAVAISSGGAGVVGYAVSVPQSAAYLSFAAGKTVELFVHTHVREDALDLYGFATRAEKELFLTLLGVNGIGPKAAIGILSGAEPAVLVQAILDNDKHALTQIPGIGKKTAERVVLELADPLRKKVAAGLLPAGSKESVRSAARVTGAAGAVSGGANVVVRDARAALLGLGYREAEVAQLIDRVLAETESAPTRVEDLVRSALRELQ
jgi:holliday junction DNA helicase RuvA